MTNVRRVPTMSSSHTSTSIARIEDTESPNPISPLAVVPIEEEE